MSAPCKPQIGRLPHVVVRNATTTTAPANPAQAASVKGVSRKDASGLQTWKCAIRSTTPLLGDTGGRLELVVIDVHSDLRSEVFSADAWRPPTETTSGDGLPGWQREGGITLAEGTVPGAVLVRKLPAEDGSPSVDYIGTIELVSPEGVHHITAHSWVSSDHGWRVFFAGAAYLPKDTPPALLDERQRELLDIQGTPETRVQERKGADRIYWYQEYNDLSAGKTGNLVRPVLGNSKRYPYPRRLATNRGNEPDGREKPPPAGQGMWLQLDEQFSFDKSSDFNGTLLQGGLTAAIALIAEAANDQRRSPIMLAPSLLLGAARQVIGSLLPGVEAPLDNFDDFNDALAMFKKDVSATGGSFSSLQPTQLYPPKPASDTAATAATGGKRSTPGAGEEAKSSGSQKSKLFRGSDGAWDFQLDSKTAANVDAFTAEKRVGPVFDSATGAPVAGSRSAATAAGGGKPQPGASKVSERLGAKLWKKVEGNTASINDILYFEVPRVLEGRPDAWHTDEEFGRQTLAGTHPCAISALKQLPEKLGSAIRAEHVNPELQGATIEQLVGEAASGAKPRLFWLDYWDLAAFWGAEEAKAARAKEPGPVQHAGRALLFLQQDADGNDLALVPVAIELAHPATHRDFPNLPASAGLVYYRSQLAYDPKTLAVWRLAKMVFKSLDCAYHQLVAHFTRTHCVLEPFFIAMRRQVSAMHPVFKLMAPHFRYTLNINRDARSSLINAGGIIERSFSAGPNAMQLAAVVYGKTWTFVNQALPEDLAERGMLGPDGRPWLDYPYATDGLDIWTALSDYFDSYLRLYYHSDEDVRADTELQAWWFEVKNEGHPDLVRFGLRTEEQVWGFSGPIPSRERLVSILTTIAWLASGHHAAVNFGQYDFSSLVLNTSSVIRRPMPAPSEKAYEDLTHAKLGSPQERVIMSYLADPLTVMTITATVKVLSAHARDEHTLDEANHLLVDPAAREANAAFISAMHRLEDVIESRNVDEDNWARFGLWQQLQQQQQAGSGGGEDGYRGGVDGPIPYTLLIPGSRPGITMRGVPYSVSI